MLLSTHIQGYVRATYVCLSACVPVGRLEAFCLSTLSLRVSFLSVCQARSRDLRLSVGWRKEWERPNQRSRWSQPANDKITKGVTIPILVSVDLFDLSVVPLYDVFSGSRLLACENPNAMIEKSVPAPPGRQGPVSLHGKGRSIFIPQTSNTFLPKRSDIQPLKDDASE